MHKIYIATKAQRERAIVRRNWATSHTAFVTPRQKRCGEFSQSSRYPLSTHVFIRCNNGWPCIYCKTWAKNEPIRRLLRDFRHFGIARFRHTWLPPAYRRSQEL